MIRAGRLKKRFLIGEREEKYGNDTGNVISTGKTIRAEALRGSGNQQDAEAGSTQTMRKAYRARYSKLIKFGVLLIDANDPDVIYSVVHVDNVNERNIEIIMTLELVVK